MEQRPFEPESDNSRPREEEPADLELSPTDIIEKLRQILGPDDIVYLLESIEQGDDIQDMIGYAYGALLEQGEDPDEVLIELGIIEPEDS